MTEMTSMKAARRHACMAYAKLNSHLLTRKLCSRFSGMTDAREWFSSASGRKITATEIAKHLGVSRNTANARIADGLSSDDIIKLARALKVRPLDALIEFGKLDHDEVLDFLEGGGTLVATASEGELALELARRLNSIRDAADWWATYELHQPEREKTESAPPVSDDPGTVHSLPSRKTPDFSNMKGAASRRVKEMYPETPDDGL